MIDYLIEFEKSNIIIKNKEKIKEYINFCMINNNLYKENDILNKHHILPKYDVYLKKFKNIKENICILTLENHVLAHKLLMEATKNHELGYAYITLLRLKKKIVNLTNEELNNLKKIKLDSWKKWANSETNGIKNIDISLEKAKNTKIKNEVYLEWGKKIKKWQKTEIILNNGIVSSNQKEVVKKSLETKRNTLDENGKNILELVGEKVSKDKLSLININNELITKAKKSIKKSLETKRNTLDENGKNILELVGEKVSKHLNKEILENGNIITIGKKRMNYANKIKHLKNKEIININGEETTKRILENKKISDTMTKKIILEDGTETNIAKEIYKKVDRISKIHKDANGNLISLNELIGKKSSITKKQLCIYKGIEMTKARKSMLIRFEKEYEFKQKYKIIGKDDNIYIYNDIKKICFSLLKTTKENFLGKSLRSQNMLIKNNKAYMIGWYIEKL